MPASETAVAYSSGANAQRFRLFARLSVELEAKLVEGLVLQEYQPGDYLVKEGQASADVFLIEVGEVALWKGHFQYGTASQVGALVAGDSYGETSSLHNQPAAETLIALTPVSARVLRPGTIENALVRDIVMGNIVRTLGSRLEEAMSGMRERHAEVLLSLRVQSSAAIFATRTLILLSFYTFCLPLFEKLKPYLVSTALFSFFVIMLFTGVAWNFLVHSSTGLSDYGFALENWRGHVKRAAKITLPLIAAATLIKAAVVWYWPGRFELFEPGRTLDSGVFHFGDWAFHTLAYVVLTFAQEVVRCAIQGSLGLFYRSSRTPDRWRSILAANVSFAATHVHLGLIFPFLALVPGFFWGWLYQRDNSYVSVVTSHVLLGTWVLFVLGVPY